MDTFKPILLLCFTVFDVRADEACPSLPYDVKQPIPAFEERHENLNLTLSCNAVEVAYNAANEMLIGNVPQVDSAWCLYTRYIFDFLALKALFIHPSLDSMPWDKIEQTAKLHPRTEYGCAYSTSLTFTGMYYATVCIYKRTSNETRCFCN
ncbi:hypothetical protein Q1695_015912 [Nippostrongylus brasiliensis]|nr:hypothetical protein Q1695_015912 [Nippostrongylus brasiliensis]